MEEERTIINYLLGSLPAAEAERLDELSLTNDGFVERLRTVENDLVDAYVMRELSGEDVERFERHYLASPMRREKVQFAQTLLGLADQVAVAQVEDVSKVSHAKAEPPIIPFWQRLFTRPSFSLAMAVTTLLLLLAGGYLWRENARLRQQMDAAQAERETLRQRGEQLQKQLADEHSVGVETEKQLGQVSEKLAQLEQQKTTQQSTKSGPKIRGLRDVSLTIMPQLRGANQIPTVTIPRGTDYVALRLRLETNDFPAYQAALKNLASNEVVWRSGRLQATGQSPGAISLRVPANLLQPQHYALELTGIAPDGKVETAGSYTFNVVTR